MAEQLPQPPGGPLGALLAEGVSPWLEGLSRSRLSSGLLTRLVTQAGLRGATSHPRALAADMAADPDCRQQLSHMARRSVPPERAVTAVCAYDLRSACDELTEVFAAGRGLDGLVSMDLNPALARDARATVAAAEQLHRAACRDNALVKIPATEEGLTAVAECLGRGIGVHITEVYSVHRYGQVLDACFDGLERALAAGLALSSVAAVTSLPVGLVEAEADARLTALGTERALALRGTAAPALARLAYRLYEQRLGGDRWRRLSAAGARPPRPMWHIHPPAAARQLAGLVAWGTAAAIPAEELVAGPARYRLHGDTLTGTHRQARQALDRLQHLGCCTEAAAGRLQRRSLARLAADWRGLLATAAGQLAPA
ncbi:transaldolase family protein [Streptomyces orinoci]|uniref:Transaldolase n=1 Tax=Streptomyces orinoci TaxID=67339 RepID=A0ABV3K4G9_STRON|nr:transaldolase family protein [Streptomyces orinoci]